MKLEANTGEMRQAAGQLTNHALEYKQQSDALLNDVNQIQGTGWVGSDAQEFVTKIESLRDDFDRMYNLMLGAANDLKESAEKYDQTQMAAKSAAASLADGF